MVVRAELHEALHLVAGEVARAARAEQAEQVARADRRRRRLRLLRVDPRSLLLLLLLGFGGCLGDGGRGGRRVLREPLPEEGEREPVHVGVGRGHALAPRGGEREAEEARFRLHFPLLQLVDFVFDDFEDVRGHGVFELAGARRPLADDVDERFGEDDLGAGEVAEFEVAGWVLGDLFPEAALELEQMVVDTRTHDLQSVVHVCEGEEAFALDVGFGDVDGVESRGVVVEDAEEVVVVAHYVAVRGVGVGFGDVGG